MSADLTISLRDLTDTERERIASVVATARRNREIRQRYGRLCEEGSPSWARSRLAEIYHRSERQIRRVLYGC